MISREVIQKILEAGAQAPSGSNSQPWKFIVRGDQVDVIGLPEKDHPVLNFRSRGTWIAHGALIENISIASKARGFNPLIELFPLGVNQKFTARINFETAAPFPEEIELYKVISKRTTNRKRYAREPLTKEQREKLFEFEKMKANGNSYVKFVEEEKKTLEMSEAFSVNEIVMFENKILHKLFFNEIAWTEKEEKKRGGGLYFKTMEIDIPTFILKIVGCWSVTIFLNKIGLARKIAKENAETYSAAPLIGVIACGENDADFIEAGRLMERIWLTASNLGLSFHLMTGVFFLWQRIQSGKNNLFSEKHAILIKEGYKKIEAIAGIKSGIATLAFRIGRDGEPTARSLKNPPSIQYLS